MTDKGGTTMSSTYSIRFGTQDNGYSAGTIAFATLADAMAEADSLDISGHGPYGVFATDKYVGDMRLR
jgi:hypothetical protein